VKPKTSIFEPASCEGFEMRITSLGERLVDLMRIADAASIRKELERADDFPFKDGSIGPRDGESHSSGCFRAIRGFESENIEAQLLFSRVAGSA
jgi:hypothetical protein